MKRALLGAFIACCAAGALVRNAHAVIAAEQYGWYDGMIIGQETSGGGAGNAACGTGTKTQCATLTTTRCTQWVITGQTGGGTAGPTGGGVNAGYTKTCAVTETTVTYLYYP